MNANTQTSVVTREKDYIRRGIVLSESVISEILSKIDIVAVVRDELATKKKHK